MESKLSVFARWLAAVFLGGFAVWSFAGPDTKLVLPFGTAKVAVVDRHVIYFGELQGGSPSGFVGVSTLKRVDSPSALMEIPAWGQHLDLHLGGYVEVVVEWIQDEVDLGFDLRYRMGRIDPPEQDKRSKGGMWSVVMDPEEVREIAKETKADVVLFLDQVVVQSSATGYLYGGQRGLPPIGGKNGLPPILTGEGRAGDDRPPEPGKAFNRLKLGMVAYDGVSGEEIDRVFGLGGGVDFTPVYEQKKLDRGRVQEFENAIKEAFWFAMQRVEFE